MKLQKKEKKRPMGSSQSAAPFHKEIFCASVFRGLRATLQKELNERNCPVAAVECCLRVWSRGSHGWSDLTSRTATTGGRKPLAIRAGWQPRQSATIPGGKRK
ncbi:hypothetical protein AVEN_8342-1 [Araneus ventricosus]|uniref:Uncharacterized protein n=1 Tax=Araneus ventricosus TaxID=182803 RepID=A0A4Y2F399_ARAVE|nr:hypothetical protein AVEN_8342-1 [Araneus ventricosus]